MRHPSGTVFRREPSSILQQAFYFHKACFIMLLFITLIAIAEVSAISGPAYFDVMPPTCKIDNWGLPKQSSKTFNTNYDKILRVPCQAQWPKTTQPFSDAHEMATAIYYKDTPSYDSFQAVDWIPENKDLYSSGSSWGKAKNTDFKSKKPKSFMSSECNLKNDDGSEWVITRIGPIVTTGGYDWLQIGWDDIWGLRDALKAHPDGVYIVEQIISPIYANGTMINHPPIHIHHMHVGPAPYVRQRFDQLGCATRGRGCFNPARTLEDHGDYNCIAADGGLNCRMESFPEGFAKLITKELGFEGELNDVRPAGSPPLEWYFQMGARWIPKDARTSRDLAPPAVASSKAPAAADKNWGLKAMSLENIAGPGTYSLFHQKEYLLTFPTPTRYESIFWYTGRMQSKGDLLRMKIHAHNSVFEEALFFAAAPEDVGLTDANGFSHATPYFPVKTTSIRDFRNNDDAKRFFMRNLEASQATFDVLQKQSGGAAQRAGEQGKCGYPDAACVRARPELICQIHAAVEVVPEPGSPMEKASAAERVVVSATALSMQDTMSLDQNNGRAWHTDYVYDRRQPTCCNPWQWESGQVFTVVGFNKYKGYPVSGKAATDEVPETLAGHVGFWMSYDEMSQPETYHWGYSLYNHYEDGTLKSVTDMKGYQKIAIAINGGTSEHWNDPSKEPYYWLAYSIYVLLTHAPFILGCLLLMLGCCCFRLVCPRGNLRPFNPKESLLTCYGLLDPSEAFPRANKAEKPYYSGSVPAVVLGPGRAPRPGNDLEGQEEKDGLLL